MTTELFVAAGSGGTVLRYRCHVTEAEAAWEEDHLSDCRSVEAVAAVDHRRSGHTSHIVQLGGHLAGATRVAFITRCSLQTDGTRHWSTGDHSSSSIGRVGQPTTAASAAEHVARTLLSGVVRSPDIIHKNSSGGTRQAGTV